MAFECIPRASSDLARQGSVDAELKTLKVLSRRLQSILTILRTELQLLQRLYYKNKNQHRGALFWRNVAEMRRSMQKVEDLNLQGSMIALRNTFYGSTDNENLNPMKGPWSHFPPEKYLINCIKQYEKALKLLEKTFGVCIRAYSSFHRSLQAAAFIQILLMFVSICSRMRSVALELHESVNDLHSCVQRLNIALFKAQPPPADNSLLATSSTFYTEQPKVITVGTMSLLPIDVSLSWSAGTQAIPSTGKLTPQGNVQQNDRITTSVVIEQKTTRKEAKSKDVKQVKTSSKSISGLKKKRKAGKNEIDEIFGF